MKTALDVDNLVHKDRPLGRTLYLAIFLLLTIGAFYRLYNISAQPYWMDEGYTINAVLGNNANYHCPLYCYPTYLIAKSVGFDAFSYRFLAAIAGILLIAAIFLFVKKFLNVWIALLSTFFITFSYYEIAWSRQARWYTLFALFFWLALYFFYRYASSSLSTFKFFFGLTLDRAAYFFLTIIFTVLAILTHGLGWILPIFMILWVIWKYLPRKLNWYTGVATIVLLAIAGLIMSKYGFKLHYNLPYYLSFYLRSYWPFFPFALFAIFNTNSSEEVGDMVNFLLFIFLAYLIPLSFFTDIVQYRYLFQVVPVIIILGSIGIYEISLKIKSVNLRYVFVGIIYIIFFLSHEGVILPQTNYFLESDDPTKTYGAIGGRSSYLFTPQPDWNGAYAFINKEMSKTPFDTNSEIVISSAPQFTKIFLDQPGYWIKYDYLGYDNRDEKIVDDKEFYVGAKVIDDLGELQQITNGNHGFIVLDYFAKGRIDPTITSYIESRFPATFHEKTNNYSEIWVYQF